MVDGFFSKNDQDMQYEDGQLIADVSDI